MAGWFHTRPSLTAYIHIRNVQNLRSHIVSSCQWSQGFYEPPPLIQNSPLTDHQTAKHNAFVIPRFV